MRILYGGGATADADQTSFVYFFDADSGGFLDELWNDGGVDTRQSINALTVSNTGRIYLGTTGNTLSDNERRVYTFNNDWTPDTDWIIGELGNITCIAGTDSEWVYVGVVVNSPSVYSAVLEYDETGTLNQIFTLDNVNAELFGLVVQDRIAYWVDSGLNGTDNKIIHRYDLDLDSPLSDLVTLSTGIGLLHRYTEFNSLVGHSALSDSLVTTVQTTISSPVESEIVFDSAVTVDTWRLGFNLWWLSGLTVYRTDPCTPPTLLATLDLSLANPLWGGASVMAVYGEDAEGSCGIIPPSDITTGPPLWQLNRFDVKVRREQQA